MVLEYLRIYPCDTVVVVASYPAFIVSWYRFLRARSPVHPLNPFCAILGALVGRGVLSLPRQIQQYIAVAAQQQQSSTKHTYEYR